MCTNKREASIIKSVYPVVSLAKWGKGLYTVKRKSLLQGRYNIPKRGKVKKMTTKSVSRLVLTIQSTPVKFQTILTLTYPREYEISGKTVKSDLKAILQFIIRKGYADKYLWFLEFQDRGAPHFHILLDGDGILPGWRRDLAWRWANMVTRVPALSDNATPDQIRLYNLEVSKVFRVNADPKAWELIRDDDGAKRYVTKYACKQFQKTVPKLYRDVGRFWGCNKHVMLTTPVWEVDACEEDIAAWLNELGHSAAEWDYLPGVLFGVRDE